MGGGGGLVVRRGLASMCVVVGTWIRKQSHTSIIRMKFSRGNWLVRRGGGRAVVFTGRMAKGSGGQSTIVSVSAVVATGVEKQNKTNMPR